MPDDHIGGDVQSRGTVLRSNRTYDLNTEDVKSISSVIAEPARVWKSTSSVLAEPDQTSRRKSRKKSKIAAAALIPHKIAVASSANPAAAKKAKKEQNHINRANELRKDYPDMQNIPKSITPAQRKRLILEHTQNAANKLQPTQSVVSAEGPKGVVPTSIVPSDKNNYTANKQIDRANALRRQYPDMGGIPPKIGKGTKRKLIAQYNARSTAMAPSLANPTSLGPKAKSGPRTNELPTRNGPPAFHSVSNSRSEKPTSSKMAPLSEERLAEVTRNLAAGSNDDPVMID